MPARKKAKKKQKRLKRRELKKLAVEFKGGSCIICGYNKCLAALTFHHRNPSKKDFGVSEMMTKLSWEDIKKELKGCVLLCSNCHTEVHNGLLDGYIDG